MLDKMDKALADLVDMTIDVIAEAKGKKHFDHDFIEAVCIVLSMAYGRFLDDK